MDEEGGDAWAKLGGQTVALLDEDPLCPACLGRVFAERSFGLTNWARGEALRRVAVMAEDIPYEPPAPEECWVCEGQSNRVEAWADRVTEALSDLEFRTYQIGCRVPAILEENDRFLRELAGLDPDQGEPLKGQLNREVGKRVGQQTGTTVDFERPDVLALLELDRETVEVSVNPAFVFGRYRKCERGIPQTEWPCTDCGTTGKELGPEGEQPCSGCEGTGYRYDRSVEGLTVPHVREAMDGTEGLFHGAGREDVDARMLGTGRPFVIEIKRPKRRYPDPVELERTINDAAEGLVEVTQLALCSYELVERVKELSAEKTYRVTIRFEEPVEEEPFRTALEGLTGATIEQRTPSRVAHRRADLVRTREVHEGSGTLTGPKQAEVTVRTEGGLYIKELMHGDSGRTQPNLAEALGTEVSVEALDVIAVEAVEAPFAPKELLHEATA